MTLESLGDIGDFVGGVAGVVTLIYLAVQIRQNTKGVLASTELQIGQIAAQFNALIAANPDLARIYRIGLAGSEPLTPDEGIRLICILGVLFYNIEAGYRQYEHGQLDEETWRSFDHMLERILASPAVVGWWQFSYPSCLPRRAMDG